MKVKQFRCDTCGGDVQVTSRFSVLVTCKYCNTVYTLNNDNLEKNEVTKPLQALSQFSLGETWLYKDKELTILGRAQLEDDEDVWNEWFVRWNSLPYWIEESGDQVIFFEKTPLTSAVPPFEEIRIGETISVGDNSLFVSELGTSTVTGIEGELPGKTAIGETYKFAQAHGEDGTIWAIEYQPNKISLLTGSMITADQLTKPDSLK